MSKTSSPLRLAVFDFDGTLVDSQYAISRAIGRACEEHGIETPVHSCVRRVVGLPLREAIAVLLPQAGEVLHESLADSYKRAFTAGRSEPDHDEPLYPGALEALDLLDESGILLGIATGKSRKGLLATLGRLGMESRFVTLQTPDHLPGKPNPDMLLEAISQTGAAKLDTLMIGDTIFDIQMARAAGVAAIGADWGYHEAHELEESGAAALAQSFEDIPKLVHTLMERK